MIIAAAAAKPVTVLCIVLAPLFLEKPQPYVENTAIPGRVAECGDPCGGQKAAFEPRNFLLDQSMAGLVGVGERIDRHISWRRIHPRACGERSSTQAAEARIPPVFTRKHDKPGKDRRKTGKVRRLFTLIFQSFASRRENTGEAILVEPRGFEPLTSAVRLRRSPN